MRNTRDRAFELFRRKMRIDESGGKVGIWGIEMIVVLLRKIKIRSLE